MISVQRYGDEAKVSIELTKKEESPNEKAVPILSVSIGDVESPEKKFPDIIGDEDSSFVPSVTPLNETEKSEAD